MCNLYDVGPTQAAKDTSPWAQTLKYGFNTRFKKFAVRKTDPSLVLHLNARGEPEASVMRWGFDREFSPAINNARSEKLRSGMWKVAWENGQRCIVPMGTFYEWTGGVGHKRTHAFQSKTDEPLWAAGLWEHHPDHGPCYTVLTTAASEWMMPIHDRMPVFLSASQLVSYCRGSHDGMPMPAVGGDVLRRMECLNPLKNLASHEGPIETGGMLPGFE
ncbi:MAG: SOS response-associated peptidase family protein [Verrucomicrobiota bacterium]